MLPNLSNLNTEGHPSKTKSPQFLEYDKFDLNKRRALVRRYREKEEEAKTLDIVNMKSIASGSSESMMRSFDFQDVVDYQQSSLPLISKITFSGPNPNESFKTEAAIYELLSQHELPFVMQFVSYKRIGETQMALTIERGSMGGSTLFDLLRSTEPIVEKDWWSIYAQLIFCLAFFEDLGVMHNDLHMGNIWIETLADEKQLQLTCHDGLTFTFSTRKIVKIFDFDFGSINATQFNNNQVKPNADLEAYYCNDLGRCSRMQKGRDYLFVSWHIYNQTMQQLPITLRVFMDSQDSKDSQESQESQEDIKAFYNMKNPPLAFLGDPCQVLSSSSTSCSSMLTNISMKTIAKKFSDSFEDESQPNSDVMQYFIPSSRFDAKRAKRALEEGWWRRWLW